MNKIIVATFENGSQGLFTHKQIANVISDAPQYKQKWRTIKAQCDCLVSWAYLKGIVSLDEYTMDGKHVCNIIKKSR